MVRRQPKLPTQTDWQFLRQHGFVIALTALMVLLNFLLSCFMSLTTPRDPTGLICYTTFGAIVAQALMIGALFAMLPCHVVPRLFLATIGGLTFALPLVMGAEIFGSLKPEMLFEFADVIPLAILGFSVPFFAARAFQGWQLRFSWWPTPSSNSKLSVGNLLIGTAIMAFAISLLQFGDRGLVVPKLVAALVCCGISFAFFVPYFLLVLRSNRPLRWIFGFVIGSYLIAWVTGGLICQLSRMTISGWELIGFACWVASVFLYSGLALLAVLRSGGSLSTNRKNDVQADGLQAKGQTQAMPESVAIHNQ